MHPYLISLIVLAFTTVLTWTPLAIKSVGAFDIIPNIFRTAQNRIFDLENGNGLAIIAFAFLIYALFESKVLQSFFTSASPEKWKKRRNLVIISLTVIASLFSTCLFWYDEYIHFIPLLIPLFLAMQLDGFSSFLCLFGGAAAGLMSQVSPLHFAQNAEEINSLVEKRTSFNGTSGIGFRLICWLVFTAIFVLFNIWYCNKIFYQNSSTMKLPKALPSSEVKPQKKLSNKFKWIILAIFGFFVTISILGTIPWFADKKEGLPSKSGFKWLAKERGEEEKWKDKITSSYPVGTKQGPWNTGETYQKIGTADKESLTHKQEDKGKQQIIAKVETEQSEKFWPKFGEWKQLQVCSWLVVGAIIICLLSKQNIANNLITAGKKTFPILVGYTLLTTTGTILKESGINDNLKKYLLSEKVTRHASAFALFGVFFLIFFLVLIFGTNGNLHMALVPTLYAVSSNTLLYGFMLMGLAHILAMFIRPDPILMNGLEASGTSYKKYLKKTWMLWLIIFLTALILISFCAFYRR